MAISTAGTGTQTATVTTEHTLVSVNAAGVYVLEVDCVNMQDGDVVELRVKAMVLTGGTARVIAFMGVYGAQPADDTIKASIPVGNELTDTGALLFTLKQTQGTSRNFPYKVMMYS